MMHPGGHVPGPGPGPGSLSLGYLCSSRDEFTALMASIEQSDHQALFTVVEKVGQRVRTNNSGPCCL